MPSKNLLFVFGTRPEAIKMAPVILAAKKASDMNVAVCVTGQHTQMVDDVLNIFGIKPDFRLNCMKQGQLLEHLYSGIINAVSSIIAKVNPDFVLVHGDTATCAATSIATFLQKKKLIHVEAGLRTESLWSPWPEEGNRRLTSIFSHINFAPTQRAKENLLSEGVAGPQIHITGNTVIDALFFAVDKINNDNTIRSELEKKYSYLNNYDRLIVLTAHRRENSGNGFLNISEAICEIAQQQKCVGIVIPVHPNPMVRDIFHTHLDGISNVHLIEPLGYLEFVYLMSRSYFMVSDSGGIQEEAPSLGKPVLLMRETTERPEAVEAGTVKLIGSRKEDIISNIVSLLNDNKRYTEMSNASNPYGNGDAGAKIIAAILQVD